MNNDPETKMSPSKSEDDYIWVGLVDGIIGLFTGVFSTRLGLGLFLFALGIFLIFVGIAKVDPGGLFTVRIVGVCFLIGGALLFRSGIQEKRRERDEAAKGPRPPIRISLRRRRR